MNFTTLRPGPKVSHQVVRDLRCLVVTLGPEATGRRLAAHLCDLLDADPALADYDLIKNFMEFSGEASHKDVEAVAAAYARHAPKKPALRYTCIATRDPNFGFWAPAMDHLFPKRRHFVLPSLEAAWAHLNHLRGRG